MSELSLDVRGVKKVFEDRTVLRDINFRLAPHEGLGIVGRNGIGKSTLAKIVAGILSPTEGEIRMEAGGEPVPWVRHYQFIGFVSPYLQLYEEFTALENLEIICKIRRILPFNGRPSGLLERVGLVESMSWLVRTYSSGMKQRLKYAAALLHKPPLLILDEPVSNLDSEGTAVVQEIMKEQIRNGILIVATNDSQDLQFCNQTLDLNTANSAGVGRGQS